MYKVNDYIIYKRDVCKINEIKKNYYGGKDYYSITPIIDNTLTINVACDSPKIKDILTKEEASKIIEAIPNVEIIDSNDKTLENIYKSLLATDDILDLVKIIKTTYLRNKSRVDSGKQIGDKDKSYFDQAEKYLYNTLGISLGMNYEETKKYIINKIGEQK